MDPILQIKNIQKTYPGSTEQALRGITLDVMPGELFGILGVNGAGKSTLLNIVIGLVTPSSGSITAFGEDLLRQSNIRQRMNIATAYAELAGNLSVQDNLKVYATIYGVLEPKKKIANLLDELQISDLARQRFDQLSAGQRTRVNLCKGLINDPDILLLDEPTASLDPSIASAVRDIIKTRQQKQHMTILLTSHNMHEVEQLCDRVALLQNGDVYRVDTPAEIVRYLKVSNMEEAFLKLAHDEE